MLYTGRIIIRNHEGLREEQPWGWLNHLVCPETTGDPDFSLSEATWNPGAVRGPVTGHEAFHCLSGQGRLCWWPRGGDQEPRSTPLQPGTEYYIRGDIPRVIECANTEPLFGILLSCHIDRPCHAHAFSHAPGVGNLLHYHGPDKWVEPLRQDFVEAMYLVEGPGCIASADPQGVSVRDYEIDAGSAVYHPLNTLHRQYHPGTSERPNFWIHAGYYHGEGRPTAGVFDLPEVALWQRDR